MARNDPATPMTSPKPAQVRPGSHGSTPRGLDLVPSSTFTEGRFGRMFRDVPVYEHDPRQLSALAKSMIAPIDLKDTEPVDPTEEDEDENPVIPAGFTYLGQFIDHDITFDPASSLQRQNDPDALHDFRTPRFDLDSVYGRGPDDQPYLYQADRVRMLLGENVGSGTSDPANGPDLPRNSLGRALTGDPRNDENLIVSQLQCLFLRFHNKMADRVAATGLTGADLFRETQRLVRWHYQWVVVNDFLRRVVDGDHGDRSTSHGASWTSCAPRPTGRAPVRRTSPGPTRPSRPGRQPFMPVEFSVAAYRFGHSMVRPSYFINDVVKARQAQRAGADLPLAAGRWTTSTASDRCQPSGASSGSTSTTSKLSPPQRSYKIDTQLGKPAQRPAGRPRHAVPRRAQPDPGLPDAAALWADRRPGDGDHPTHRHPARHRHDRAGLRRRQPAVALHPQGG